MAGIVEQVVNANRDADSLRQYKLSLDGSQAGMAFLFRSYDYNSTQFGFVGDDLARGTTRLGASILLPLANNLTDSYSVNVGSNEIGSVGAIGLALGGQGLRKTYDDFKNSAQDLLNGVLDSINNPGSINYNQAISNARAYGSFVGRNFASLVPGASEAEKGYSVATGNAINPQAALVFNGVSLKTHAFEWKLSPKNAQEATTIRDMANTIRKASLPSYAGPGEGMFHRSLLKYPDIVDISFVGVNEQYFYKFKPALIQSFSVNYAPEGVVLNRGGIPSSVSFNMNVIEAQIHTKEDYQ